MIKKIFLLSFFLNCSFDSEYGSLKNNALLKSPNSNTVILRFIGFEEYSVLVDLQIRDIKIENNFGRKCSEIIFDSKFKAAGENLKIELDKKEYCIRLVVRYSTFRPFGKNENAFLIVNFQENERCLQLPNVSAIHLEEYNCPSIDLSKYSREIIFSNKVSSNISERKVILSWSLTTMLLLRPPPLIYFAPFPFLATGFATYNNRIGFEVN